MELHRTLPMSLLVNKPTGHTFRGDTSPNVNYQSVFRSSFVQCVPGSHQRWGNTPIHFFFLEKKDLVVGIEGAYHEGNAFHEVYL